MGFGGLLGIVALGGIGSLLVLSQVRKNDEQIRSQYLLRNHLLNDLRTDLYLSGTYVRDYLLEPDTSRAEVYRLSLEEIHKEMENTLSSYAAQLDPEETDNYTALQAELSGYWEILKPTLLWTPAERRERGYMFLRDEVFPRRQQMLGSAGQIGNINEQELTSGNEELVALLTTFQGRLAATLLATLALGVGMAAFSIRKLLNLERHAYERYREVAEAKSQLTQLSDRLVQAQETERRALSRELHDEVGQSLSAVLVELRNLTSGLATRPVDQSRSQVELIKSLIESTVRVVRNMALLLRPSMLDDLGLVPALRWQAREVSKRTGLDVSVATDLNSDDLPDDYKTCIYRVVQEALHNCSRHANATAVRIRVTQEAHQLEFSIQDDGQGFDAGQNKGLGLLGIEERVARLGGVCTIHSEPGTGTILKVSLPFNEDRAKQRNTSASETNPNPISR